MLASLILAILLAWYAPSVVCQYQRCGETCQRQQHGALVDLYNALDGPNWRAREGWLSSESHCTWEGVSKRGLSLELYAETHAQLRNIRPKLRNCSIAVKGIAAWSVGWGEVDGTALSRSSCRLWLWLSHPAVLQKAATMKIITTNHAEAVQPKH